MQSCLFQFRRKSFPNVLLLPSNIGLNYRGGTVMLRGSETILINWILHGYNMQRKGFKPLTSFLAFLLTAKLLLLFILIFWEKKVKAYTIKYMYMYIYGKSSFNDYQGNDECHKA